MAIKEPTGWSPRTEWIESAYHGDPSIAWECPTLARSPDKHTDGCAHCAGVNAFLGDGRREHLTVREDVADPPTRIRYRAMTAMERSIIRDEVARKAPVRDEGESDLDYFVRCERYRVSATTLHAYLAATVALDFPDWKVERIEWLGLKVLPAPFLTELGRMHGDGFLRDFGLWIWSASSATDSQKKTSSSTPTATPPASSTAGDASASQNGASDSRALTSGSSVPQAILTASEA